MARLRALQEPDHKANSAGLKTRHYNENLKPVPQRLKP